MAIIKVANNTPRALNSLFFLKNQKNTNKFGKAPNAKGIQRTSLFKYELKVLTNLKFLTFEIIRIQKNDPTIFVNRPNDNPIKISFLIIKNPKYLSF